MIVVDDGVATGVTDTAALRAVRRMAPRRVVLAVPVCSPDAVGRLRGEADEVVCLRVPRLLRGVGQSLPRLLPGLRSRRCSLISGPEQTLLREAQPLSGADDDYDALLDLIGDARSS